MQQATPSERQLLIYDHVVPIASVIHANVSVEITATYGFARNLNSVPLLSVEFVAAAIDHPVVFARNNGSIFPAALLSLRPGCNDSIDLNGGWQGGYIPAFLRRYPFVFSHEDHDGKDTFTLCIDESAEGFNREGRGERLFDADGNRTDFLKKSLGFVAEFQTQFHRTRAFCDALVELDLLEEAQARYRDASGADASMGGFAVLNRAKLKQISAAKLRNFFDRDLLDPCFAHLHSLQNILKLGNNAQYQIVTPV